MGAEALDNLIGVEPWAGRGVSSRGAILLWFDRVIPGKKVKLSANHPSL